MLSGGFPCRCLALHVPRADRPHGTLPVPTADQGVARDAGAVRAEQAHYPGLGEQATPLSPPAAPPRHASCAQALSGNLPSRIGGACTQLGTEMMTVAPIFDTGGRERTPFEAQSQKQTSRADLASVVSKRASSEYLAPTQLLPDTYPTCQTFKGL